MNIPVMPVGEMVDKEGNRTKEWDNYFVQLTQNMQQALSDEGFWIPSVSSANNSVTPPVSGGQLGIVQGSYGQQGGVNLGTIVYDPNTNQLKALLNDGSFHPITTT